MLINRSRPRGPGRFLQWKIRLVAVGAVLLLVGMARGLDLLVILSIVVLAGAIVLRFFERDDDDPAAEALEDDDTEEDAADWVSRRETDAAEETMRRGD